MNRYKAFVVSELKDGSFKGKVEDRYFSELQPGEVRIRVEYSSVNYKDVLSAMGNKGITKHYPHVPGIDAGGKVVECNDGAFAVGDEVVVMGYDLGMNTDGGFAEMVSVPSSWVMKLPEEFTVKECMAIGTAGFTAGLGVSKLLKMGQSPDLGAVVVSGATGGVGGYAVEMLSRLGFEVWASTGKSDMNEYLKSIGAARIIGRDEICDKSNKPLLKSSWAGAFDTVGGDTLSTLVRGCGKLGSVVTCGSVGGSALGLTIFPFILNGVNLLGINAADTLMKDRIEIWNTILKQLKPKDMDRFYREIRLEDLEDTIAQISNGKNSGRVIINLN